jgi:2-phosphosulfolactate phosphatase
MDIQILQLLEGAKAAKGFTVIIDVFRAFTVEAYMAKNNAYKIIPVKDVQTAFDFKKEHPDAILCGERNGVIIDGFDFGNSPADLEHVDLTGKTVIHTTSAGTQGIANASGADEIITDSLANAGAIAAYIKQKNPEQVSLVCMGWNADQETDEDTLCGEYIKSLLEGSPLPDIEARIENLKYTTGAKFFDPQQQSVFPKADFALCTDVDKFDFVMRLTKSDDGLNFMLKV